MLSNFNWKEYIIINEDLRYMNEDDATNHFIKNGMKEKRSYIASDHLYSLEMMENDLKEFNHQKYLELNEDLKSIGLTTSKDLWKHWLLYGRKEGRKFKEEINKEIVIRPIKINNNILLSDVIKYKHLFHKYLLHISDFNKENIDYDIIFENLDRRFLFNRLWCSIHCYDINKFNDYFGEYITRIKKYFSVIVTYSEGFLSIENYDGITFIKIQNRGLDIGSKLISIDYLYRKNIIFDNILFLHSKSDNEKRKKFLDSYVCSDKQINYLCSICGRYDLIISDIIHDGDWNKRKGYTINSLYYNEFNKFMGFSHLTNLNHEGNCVMVSSKLIKRLFPKKLVSKFYGILNFDNSFDYNWVKFYYKINNRSIVELYSEYLKSNLNGNFLTVTHQNVINNYENIFDKKEISNSHSLRDGCIEHLIERLWINTCLNLGGEYKIINVLEENKLDFQFDSNLYRLINNKYDRNTNNDIDSIEKIKSGITDEIYSLEQILRKLPLNFDIDLYVKSNCLWGKNMFEVINHYYKSNLFFSNTFMDNIGNEKYSNKKTFVYIFPQFHEIEENNDFWGEGFTEWVNVRRTKQIHNKHLPMHPHHDIGYYNILDTSTRERWCDYANNYGFYGFIYCHFWFSKGIIMDKPLNKILEDNQPNKPWFLNWINENWTKRWDGGNNEILLDVRLNESDCDNHFLTILKYFKHHNYHKENNKPFLGIYRPNEIPKFYIDRFNELAIENGFDGIKFIKTLNNNMCGKNINNLEYWEYEFEYPPNYSGTLVDTRVPNSNLSYYSNNTFSTNYDIKKHYCALTKTKFNNKRIRGVMPCWDNYPRHTNNTSMCHIQLDSNSFIFFLHLVKTFLTMQKENSEYFFINSLNEWAEQCILEPSIQNEYSYLIAYKFAVNLNLEKIDEKLFDKLLYFDLEDNKNRIDKHENLFNKYLYSLSEIPNQIEYIIIKKDNKETDCVCHLYCFDIDKFDEIYGKYIDKMLIFFKIILTYSIGDNIPNIDCTIIKIKNKGRDIGALLIFSDYLMNNNIEYKYILTLHSKSDVIKREKYFHKLIGSEEIIIDNLKKINQNDVLFNDIIVDNLDEKYASNKKYHKEIISFLGVKDKEFQKFNEGNCLFMSKRIFDFLFSENRNIFYGILNDNCSFDINWVKIRYDVKNKSDEELIRDWKKNSSYMDLNHNGIAVANNFSNFSNDMPDGMVEHVFERIYVNIVNHFNGNFLVL